MARKPHEDALGVTGAETVIGTGVTVTGNLTSESDIVINGTLDGKIETIGDVVIGVNAVINANVSGSNITIAGTLKGNILAQGVATIRETGHVSGDIKSSGIAISPGGIFIGRSIMSPPAELSQDLSAGLDEGRGAKS